MLGESTEKKSQTSPLQGFLLTQGILGKSKGAMLAGRVSSLLKVFWGESKGSMLSMLAPYSRYFGGRVRDPC